MNARAEFRQLLRGPEPVLALAPMQDVTDLPFMELISRYGNADVYFTEYFRVLPQSRLDPAILKSITHNPTGRPVVAQMIGNDIAALVRTARELQQHPVAAIDLNLGCPVPIVYKKCAGGGLLRDPERVDQILGALRAVWKFRSRSKRASASGTQIFSRNFSPSSRVTISICSPSTRAR